MLEIGLSVFLEKHLYSLYSVAFSFSGKKGEIKLTKNHVILGGQVGTNMQITFLHKDLVFTWKLSFLKKQVGKLKA